MTQKILIIKHGAFGDIVKAVPVLNSIHHHFKGAKVTLLTDPRFTNLHHLFFNYEQTFLDERNKDIVNTVKLLRAIKLQNFDLIIDLQNSGRTNYYYYILKYILRCRTPWSGTAHHCDFYLPYHIKKTIAVTARFDQQLKLLNIPSITYSKDLASQHNLIDTNKLPKKFALMIFGCSIVSPEKRWPLNRYIALSHDLEQHGITSIFIGGPQELDCISTITQQCPKAIVYINQLSYRCILAIAHRACVIIGNDTGPLYLAQLSSQPTCILWSAHSDPALHAPQGPHVHIIQNSNIAMIQPCDVTKTLARYI